MKILFVSMVAFENNTSATIQNKGIVKGLTALGHELDILTLAPNKNAFSYDDSMNDIKKLVKNSYYIEIDSKYAMLMAKKQKNKEINRNENISKINFVIKKGRLFIKKVYDNISIHDAQKFNVKGISKLKVNYSKYEIIISAADPKSSHLIVKRIFRENKKCRAKWIQYWGDPMLIDITRKSDWRDGIVKYEESRLLDKADSVIYASPLTLAEQKKVFPKLSYKMDYVSQAYADVPSNILRVNEEQKDNTPITAGYFGTYNSKVRNIIPLYNAARSNTFKLNICGDSDINLENKNNISIYGKVSYSKALEMEKKSDILVCICNREGTQIPGKIYYCASYNKPIILILDSEYKEYLRSYFQKYNRYILCDNDSESILKAIKEAKAVLGRSSYILSEQLTPKYMAKKILSEYNTINHI